jgi:hypothetical protein
LENASSLPLRSRASSLSRAANRVANRVDAGTSATWLVQFLLIVYLGLSTGGFDPIVRGEVGIAVWWIVLIGAAVGALPLARIGRAGWIAFGLLAAFVAWTALGIGWSESAERSVSELGRVAAYLGVLALALALGARSSSRRTASAVGSAIALIAGLALLSRLHPAWFPADQTAAFLPREGYRLSYPLNYWNALAALVAIGLPLMLSVATSARTLLARALAAAALPMMALTVYFTFSRAGTAAAVLGLIAFVALARERVLKLGTILLAGAGSAILIAAADQRDALSNHPFTGLAHQQGDKMLAMVLVVCAGVALIQVGLALALRHGQAPGWARPQRRTSGAILGAGLAALLVVALAAGLPGELSQRWQDFKQPNATPGSGAGRLASTAGNGRYQYWQAAARAEQTDPVKGRGPGTFEYWWSRDGQIQGFVRDAHSLYMQTLAETGIVGLLLLGAFLLWALGLGAIRAVRAGPRVRTHAAAIVAAGVAFATAAAADWTWQIAVIPAAFLLLMGAAISADGNRAAAPGSRRQALASRAILGVCAVAALVAIAIPLASDVSLRQSQAEAAAGHLGPALAKARSAAAIQGYAAAPKLQQALLLEQAGDLSSAATIAGAATTDEPTNWRTWAVLSRIEAERGRGKQSVIAYDRAKALDPRSPLFQQ